MRRGRLNSHPRFDRDGCRGCREARRQGWDICRACEDEAEAIAEARR